MTTVEEHGESSPLVRIRSLLPGLARAEQRVADVVLADPAAVARNSITELAEQAGTSETTVTRFCKAIGVGGYPELRIALASDVARTASLAHGAASSAATSAPTTSWGRLSRRSPTRMPGLSRKPASSSTSPR